MEKVWDSAYGAGFWGTRIDTLKHAVILTLLHFPTLILSIPALPERHTADKGEVYKNSTSVMCRSVSSLSQEHPHIQKPLYK